MNTTWLLPVIMYFDPLPYFASVGAAQLRDVTKLFGWSNEIANRTVNKLVEQNILVKTAHPKQVGEWIAISKII